jgi:hypothetical protein
MATAAAQRATTLVATGGNDGDDGDGATGDGATGYGETGYGATGYDDNDEDGDRRRRIRR